MKLIINEQEFFASDFKNLFELYADESTWEGEIVRFVRDWFDERPFVEVKTSGSTGIPKTIKMPKAVMRASAEMTNAYFSLNSESTALLCLPASYIAGKMMIVRPIVGEYTLKCVQPAANPFKDLQEKFDFTAITPYQLVHSEELQSAEIKNIIVGGSPVTAEIEKKVAIWKPAFYETFGMTETASHIALRRFNGSNVSDAFEILKGVKISTDNRNCLVINAPHLYQAEIITNDIVELVTADQFKWLGRYDRVINTGGVKVFPEQIEKKIEPFIDSPFFISSMSDPKLGEKVILIIESESQDKNNIIGLISNHLTKFEMPKEIYFIPQFVYSVGNKVLRADTLKKIK